jgi:hypothetical protein
MQTNTLFRFLKVKLHHAIKLPGMRKIINYLLLSASTLLLFACEKNIATYSGETNIYFSNSSDSAKISFAYDQAVKKDSLISVRVYAMGPVSDADREFKLTIVDTLTNALPGTHYTLLNDPVVIKAGEAFANLQFRLNRTSDMKAKSYYISLLLEPNVNFITNYSRDWLNLNQKTWRQLLMYTIKFDDILSQPKTWIVSVYGAFTRKKLYAISEFFELELPIWNITGAGGIPATMIGTYGKVFQRYLNDEAARGNVILDEDGTPMKMGASSQ